MYKNERSNSFFMGIVTVLFYIFYVECLRENNNTRIYILAFGAFAGLVLVRALFGGKMLEFSKFFVFCILFYAFSYMHTWIGYTWYPYSSYDMLDQILMQYASFYVIFLFFKNFDNTDKIVNLFITSCVIMTLLSLGSSISTLGSERLGGWFNSNTVAVFSGFIATFAYTLFLRDKKIRYLIIVAYLVVIVLLTGSRKGLLTVGVGIIAINILLTKNYKLLKILAFIPLLIVAYHIIMNWETSL